MGNTDKLEQYCNELSVQYPEIPPFRSCPMSKKG